MKEQFQFWACMILIVLMLLGLFTWSCATEILKIQALINGNQVLEQMKENK